LYSRTIKNNYGTFVSRLIPERSKSSFGLSGHITLITQAYEHSSSRGVALELALWHPRQARPTNQAAELDLPRVERSVQMMAVLALLQQQAPLAEVEP
jgi:hypothetical protein